MESVCGHVDQLNPDHVGTEVECNGHTTDTTAGYKGADEHGQVEDDRVAVKLQTKITLASAVWPFQYRSTVLLLPTVSVVNEKL